MKTITIEAFLYSELSDEAKQNAYERFLNNSEPDYWFLDEVNTSFKKFAEIFNINWSNIDYQEPYRNEYEINLDDNILELSGQRLAKYIWNNYKRDLFKGKYYSLWSKTEISYKYHKEGFPVLKSRYSKITLDNDCVLTGVCYDYDLLQPIYDFLDKPTKINFETLLNDCIYSLCHSVSNEIEYRQSEECFSEDMEANEVNFDSEGKVINY